MQHFSTQHRSTFIFTILATTCSVAMSMSDIKVITQENITRQSVSCSFYPQRYSDEQYSIPEKIASISYELENASTIYLNHIKIYDRNARNKGLGKTLFTFFMQHLQNKNSNITTVILQAATLDGMYLPQAALEQWYSNRGGKRVGPHPHGGSLFTFDVKTFQPEQDLSSLNSCKLYEYSTIESSNSQTLTTKNGAPIATIIYRLFINLVHSDEENITTYQVIIKDFTVDTNYSNQKDFIEYILKHEILKALATKKWLRVRSKL